MINELVQLCSTITLGLLSGSLLMEALVLVPYWRKMQATDFLALHHSMGPRLFVYFMPITVLAVVLPVLALLSQLIFSARFNGYVGLPVVLTLLMLGVYFYYFKAANESFKTGSIGVEGVAKELSAWASWHWLRIAFVLSAFVISLLLT